jgi:HEAT repeat protein
MCPDCASLQQQLQDAVPFKRRQAARELADCPDAAANLVAQLLCEADHAVREMIFSSLTTLGDAVAVAGMVRCLRSEHAALRNEAIESMKTMPVQVAPIMVGLLNDADPDVRIFAVNILESLCHPNVEPWLIGVIEHDPEVNVCGTAVDLLCELGSEASRTALIQLKARFTDEPYIQFAVDLALKRLTTG